MSVILSDTDLHFLKFLRSELIFDAHCVEGFRHVFSRVNHHLVVGQVFYLVFNGVEVLVQMVLLRLGDGVQSTLNVFLQGLLECGRNKCADSNEWDESSKQSQQQNLGIESN